MLTLAVGKEIANGFSFRTFALRKFHLLFLATMGVYVLIILIFFRRYVQRNKGTLKRYLSFLFPQKNTILVISAKQERKVA
jgi:hypothetical protein